MRAISESELQQVSGGKIVKVNGGGNTPSGQANGVPYKNPAGKEPSGWNR